MAIGICLCYIELNMVRCGVVKHPRDWAWVDMHNFNPSGGERGFEVRSRRRVIAREQCQNSFTPYTLVLILLAISALSFAVAPTTVAVVGTPPVAAGAKLWVLHTKSDRDSNSCRTLILKQVGHLFQSKSDRCSNGKSDSFCYALQWLSDMDWNAIPIQVGDARRISK